MTAEPRPPRIRDAAIRLRDVPGTGRNLTITPDKDEEEAIAAFLDVSAVKGLSLNLDALPFRGGVRVSGRLRAKVTQPCVVTFVPVEQEIDEPVDRVFLPGAERPFAGPAGAEVFVDLSGDEIPDFVEGPEADLSDLVVESLALAIDPYPRAEGASVADVLPPVEETASPFALLRTLKTSDGD